MTSLPNILANVRKRAGASVCLLLLSTASGCAPTVSHTDSYHLPLETVRRPADVAERWGDYAITGSEDGMTYEDELLAVTAALVSGKFVLAFENKTEHSLRILWDETTFVDVDDLASGVDAQATTTVVPAHSKVIAVGSPLLLDSSDTFFPNADSEELARIVGEEMQLIVPIRVQDTINEYTFVFRVASIERERCGELVPGKWDCETTYYSKEVTP